MAGPWLSGGVTKELPYSGHMAGMPLEGIETIVWRLSCVQLYICTSNSTNESLSAQKSECGDPDGPRSQAQCVGG